MPKWDQESETKKVRYRKVTKERAIIELSCKGSSFEKWVQHKKHVCWPAFCFIAVYTTVRLRYTKKIDTKIEFIFTHSDATLSHFSKMFNTTKGAGPQNTSRKPPRRSDMTFFLEGFLSHLDVATHAILEALWIIILKMDRIQRGRAMPIHPRLNDKWREKPPPQKNAPSRLFFAPKHQWSGDKKYIHTHWINKKSSFRGNPKSFVMISTQYIENTLTVILGTLLGTAIPPKVWKLP